MRRIIFICALFAFGAGATAEPVVRIGGTGASLALLQALAADWNTSERGSTVEIVEGLGSSGSIRALTAAHIEVAVAGRPLRDEEKNAALSVEPYLKTPVGFFTSSREMVSVARDEVWTLYAHPGVENPVLGGLVLRPILRQSDDSDSMFVSAHFPRLGEAIAQARDNGVIPVAQTDQENADLAEEIDDSVTTGTLLQMISEKRRLHPVVIGGVTPDLATAKSGAYPWIKTLYLVMPAAPGPDVAALLDWMRSADALALAEARGAAPAGERTAAR